MDLRNDSADPPDFGEICGNFLSNKKLDGFSLSVGAVADKLSVRVQYLKRLGVTG